MDNPLQAPYDEGFADGLEAAAKLAAGMPHHVVYRTWPWWQGGNRHKDSDVVQHADRIAAEIRALIKTPQQ